MYKRMISMLLALVLLLGNVPVTVLAAEIPVVLAEKSAEAPVEIPMEAVTVTEDAMLSVTGVVINEITFPDPVFRAYIMEKVDTGYSGYDEDGRYTTISRADGILTLQEIQKCTSLYLTKYDESSQSNIGMGIQSLEGIQHLTSLTYLVCGGNQLVDLDVSANTALTFLQCESNQLTNLDVSSNTALTHLYCYGNQLTSLDISGCSELMILSCFYNQLDSLDISNCTALTDVSCSYNQLTSLDVSACVELKHLDCYNNQLTSLDVTDCSTLATLLCHSNQLTSLDVSSCTGLTSLSCSDNGYPIFLNIDGSIDLSSLPGNFDVSKTSDWQGGVVNGTILTVENGVDTVTYCYDCGNNESMTFTLLINRPEHTHSYTEEIVTDTYLKTAATCTKTAIYYKSCACGEKGSSTFFYGKPLDHKYQNGKCERCGDVQAVVAPAVTGSVNTISGKPKLTWKAVDGAVKYQIYRSKTGKAGSFGLINTVKTLTTTNNSAVAGTKYYYKVRAVMEDGTKSDYSNVVTITCDLARPTGVKITSNATTGKNVISWNAVPGASKYQVWYSATGKTGSFKVLMTTKSLTHTHGKAVAGTKYYYKVSAVHANTAANSALAGAFSRVCDLAAPSGVTVSATAAGKNKISWEAVEGAAKYQVWFSKTGKAGSFKILMTTRNLNHTHKGGVAGQTYYYKVKAIHTNTNANSAYSAVVSRISR